MDCPTSLGSLFFAPSKHFRCKDTTENVVKFGEITGIGSKCSNSFAAAAIFAAWCCKGAKKEGCATMVAALMQAGESYEMNIICEHDGVFLAYSAWNSHFHAFLFCPSSFWAC